MPKSNSSKRLRVEEYQVSPLDRPGWVRGSTRPLAIGDEVYCAAGEGTVASVRGRTGDGSRLLQIQLSDEQAAPFYAAASNVLVLPG